MIRRFARPYAKALSEIISSPAEARKVYAELMRFETVRAGSSELRELFHHPGIELGRKKAVIQEIGKKLELRPTAVRILEVLITNRRINEIGSVLEAWREMINRAEGIEVAEVRVAHELNKTEEEKLRKALEARFGKRVELHWAVEPRLLGGFVATVGSEIYDASVTGRIEKFRQSLHQ